jgi:cbb3-type cytochrome oxidase subunit 3
MSERARTILLVLLIIFAIGFIVWANSSYESNFTEVI